LLKGVERLDASREGSSKNGGAWSWKHVVLTTRWRPEDPNEYSVQSLSERLDALVLGLNKVVWPLVRRHGPEATLFWKFELGLGGHVHMHLLVYSRYIDKSVLEIELSVRHPRLGFTFVEKVRGIRNGVAELGKYIAKLNSSHDEDWIEGTRRRCINSALLARWEIATLRRRLFGARGPLVGFIPSEKDLAEEGNGDEPKNPPTCGSCGGEIARVRVRTLSLVWEMHSMGMRVFRDSEWSRGDAVPRDVEAEERAAIEGRGPP
jgi:hypothetical protein